MKIVNNIIVIDNHVLHFQVAMTNKLVSMKSNRQYRRTDKTTDIRPISGHVYITQILSLPIYWA